VPAARPPDLEIVSLGSEPRTLLRYQPVVGTKQRLQVTIDLEVGAGDMGGPLPSLVMTLAVSVDGKTPAGQAKVHAAIENVVAVDQGKSKISAASLGPVLEPLKGIGFDALLTPEGRVSAATLDARARALPKMTQTSLGSLVDSFAQTLMPLPDVPVGPGAVWRTSRALNGNGLALTSVSSVSLTRVSGSTFEYTLDSTLHGDDQSIADSSGAGSGSAETGSAGSGSAGSGSAGSGSAAATGTSLVVKGITGRGSGKGTVDLVTLAATTELIADLQSEMTAPGETEATKMEMASMTRVRPIGSNEGLKINGPAPQVPVAPAGSGAPAGPSASGGSAVGPQGAQSAP
jgi:hypothetical protein